MALNESLLDLLGIHPGNGVDQVIVASDDDDRIFGSSANDYIEGKGGFRPAVRRRGHGHAGV